MLGADFMPSSKDATLQQGEGILYCVGMNWSINVNAGLVFNGLVAIRLGGSFHRSGVGVVFIGDDNVNIFADVFLNELGERAGFGVGCMEETNGTAALTDADYYLFLAQPMPRFVLVTALDSTDIRFIHFNRASEL